MMGCSQPRILLVHTYYPEFLQQLYADDLGLTELDFDEQRKRILSTAFGVGDAYSHGLRALGCDAQDVILNADRLQKRWATEHNVVPAGNVHERRRQVFAAQVSHLRPDIVFVFEWSPLGDSFLEEIKASTRLLVGQVASPLRPERTYAAYDLMVSSFPPIVDHFRSRGQASAHLKLAFDERILERITTSTPTHDVTFVGGFAPSHPNRAAWLETILAKVEVDVFGYGLERIAEQSIIRAYHRGPAWGIRMYEVLRQSRITLNLHAEIGVGGSSRADWANNMRLYEATGMGTCLLTDVKGNLADLFDPQREVVTFEDADDCAAKIAFYLKREPERMAIAQAGQKRTLRDHRYTTRMGELLDLLTGALASTAGVHAVSGRRATTRT